mgnify:CR=1 FL=1
MPSTNWAISDTIQNAQFVLNLFHWLGALITNPVINGTKDTPVRAVIDRAAALIDRPKLCFAPVVGVGAHRHAPLPRAPIR